ncbi:hypothetical protein GA0070558_13238 [Micromonospora haikouensis]|uniref:Beta-galactosidase n=1 Tax=Micromonospora haikouensis TaxID=686309 RepID=A0A1C4Y0H4_9ACTN|nr:hypothetical protein [Micromonospora haikouensis]SCF13881.1 hypothetical protein GA0070558_13238 [Micromonospora haikouensis]
MSRRTGRPVLLAGVLLAALVAGAACSDEPAPRPAPSATGPSAATPSAGATGAPPAGATARNPFGAHWDWSRYDQFVPYLEKLSGSATYHELSWCDIEKTQGSPDFSAVDRIAERSRQLGITLHLKIRTGVCWATGGTAKFTRGQANKTESAIPRDLAAYQAFVRALVQRYAPYGVREYAIENEVNAQQYWAGSPEDYRRLVTAAAEAIRSADPQATVVDSGMSSVAYGMGVADRLLRAGQPDQAVAAYQAYFQRRVGTRGRLIPAVADPTALRAALDNTQNSRNLAYLAVTEKLLDDRVVDVRQLHFYEHFSGVPALLDYLRAETPAGVPVQAWEVGQFWKDGADDAAARGDEMVKVVSLLVAGGIHEVLWLPLAYNPDNRAGAEVRYGLLDPDGTQRQAGAMLAALAAAARDATVEPVNAKGLTGVAFRRGAESTLVVWSTTGGTVSLPATAGVTGGPVGADPAARTGALPIGPSPVLLRANGDPAGVLAPIR